MRPQHARIIKLVLLELSNEKVCCFKFKGKAASLPLPLLRGEIERIWLDREEMYYYIDCHHDYYAILAMILPALLWDPDV